MTPKQDKQQLIGGVAVFILFFCGLLWLQYTNQPPRLDHATPDTQIAVKQSYELKGVFKKYAQECYDGTHEKN